MLQAVCSCCLERCQKLPDEGRGPNFSKSGESSGSVSGRIVGWCLGESDMEMLARAVLRAPVGTPQVGTDAFALRAEGSR